MEDPVQFITDIWAKGGWLMIPLAVLGIGAYYAIFELIFFLMRMRTLRKDPNAWQHWIDRPEEAQGHIGEMIRYANADLPVSMIRSRVTEIRASIVPAINRRIFLAQCLIGAAPLVGLLGTVIGMLATFKGLSVAFGGNTVDMVAGGISEALITTQTGLVIAIPGLFLLNLTRTQRLQLEAFFNRLEILTIKQHHKRIASAA